MAYFMSSDDLKSAIPDSPSDSDQYGAPPGRFHNPDGIALRSPWVRAADLPKLFCSWDLAYRCTKNGWLNPVVRGRRRTIYRLADVLACLKKIEAGEVPPARPSRARS